jgi:hypothetical protein
MSNAAMSNVISKDELGYSDYSWSSDYSWGAVPGNNLAPSSPPTGKVLSRREGYEVLSFINKFIQRQAGWTYLAVDRKKDVARKVEMMIRVAPDHLQSQDHVEAWIMNNWRYYIDEI